MTATLDAISMGQAARRAFSDEAEGGVLAVFRHSFYVEMADGRLACIGGPGLGDGPLNLRVSLGGDAVVEAVGLAAGDEVRAGEDHLHIPVLGTIRLSAARHWRPTPCPTPSSVDLATGLAALERIAGEQEGEIGLGWTLTGRQPTREADRLLMARAVPAIDAMAAWLQAALDWPDAPPSPDGADGLVGLGPGLTPSGDDWLGGAMIALHGFGRADVARRLSMWTLPLAQGNTGKISIAHLAAAAGGEGAAALHDALAAVAKADDGAISAAVTRLDNIGHSSGWDALAGAATVMRLLAVG